MIGKREWRWQNDNEKTHTHTRSTNLGNDVRACLEEKGNAVRESVHGQAGLDAAPTERHGCLHDEGMACVCMNECVCACVWHG